MAPGDITESDVKKLTEAGLGCYVRTVNDPKETHELIKWGVIGITTDKPALMLEKGVGKVRKE